ncbi:hypothetical protein AB0I66_38935 [Streptomyces sp. NPDC050439]|uniref:hypothetical protein n=1 Tax=unclassified Streptomyces TaxID=2593676 RepID=UPI00341369C6
MTQQQARFRPRDGFGIAAAVLVLAAVVVGFFWAKGAWRSAIRQAPDLMVDWPGGAWVFGAVCGLLAVAGVIAGLWITDAWQGTTAQWRIARGVGKAVSWGLPAVLTLYFLQALPGRNCRSYEPTCQAVDGVGPAIASYAITAGAVGWAVHRFRSRRTAHRQAERQARLRKLRKKGKGKSRAAG